MTCRRPNDDALALVLCSLVLALGFGQQRLHALVECFTLESQGDRQQVMRGAEGPQFVVVEPARREPVEDAEDEETFVAETQGVFLDAGSRHLALQDELRR